MSQCNIQIHRANLQDLNRLLEIEHLAFRDPWSSDALSQEFDRPYTHVYIAKTIRDERFLIVGYLIHCTLDHETEIIRIATHPDHQRQGVAKGLIQDMIKRCRVAMPEIPLFFFLEVRQSNPNAIALYQNLGFQIFETRRKYYQNPEEDALLMRFVDEGSEKKGYLTGKEQGG